MLVGQKKQRPVTGQQRALRAVRKGSPGRVAVKSGQSVCRCPRESATTIKARCGRCGGLRLR